MESFFSSPKTKRTARKTYRTRSQANADVFNYVARFYNPIRRHRQFKVTDVANLIVPMLKSQINCQEFGKGFKTPYQKPVLARGPKTEENDASIRRILPSEGFYLKQFAICIMRRLALLDGVKLNFSYLGSIAQVWFKKDCFC